MPWCEDCGRYWTPPAMTREGGCPTCGRLLTDTSPVGAPWHFKLLMVAVVLYLGFRAYQGVVWLVEHV